jgi:ureidoglycolate hydrolase
MKKIKEDICHSLLFHANGYNGNKYEKNVVHIPLAGIEGMRLWIN